ncbi:hypothetical protein BJ684DRAFT_21324 [Piptocephalis cylindrospora]|uniref:J domain-containing protein n=1 Tax=Piptocephalis cylindrospora TaxID=1907219 RepID=A0A4P9Y0U2_9FUNG|nr:hypothetical protein BJ684DRAFT_21324 [Piptocephalis cylindrospora]|eukprot:RKP12112.1 hypothetical protein BJ684DRAFT_21324 [Piptocephalis cylindrospora]
MSPSLHDILRDKFPDWKNAPLPAQCSCLHPHPTCPFRALGMKGPVDRALAKSRYYDLCRILHPDIIGSDREGRAHFHRVSEAWRLLELRPMYAPSRSVLSTTRPSCSFQYGIGLSSGMDHRYGGHGPTAPSPPIRPARFLLNGTLIATVFVALGIVTTMKYCKEQYGHGRVTPSSSSSLSTAPPLQDERAIGRHLKLTEERARREGAEGAMNRFREEAKAHASLYPDRPSTKRDDV